jgi:mRNA interferase RelE/StbE
VKQIAFSAKALRQWRKLSPDVRTQIEGKLAAFAKTSYGDIKRLQGRDEMRLRAGDWRVIFITDDETITVQAVGHRRAIYD